MKKKKKIEKEKSSMRFTLETLLMLTAFVAVTYCLLTLGLNKLEMISNGETKQELIKEK